MRRVSMREIAKEAGVSLATVSYALRGHNKIPAATRDKIVAIAEKLGYTPDPSFAVLGARRWEKQSSYNGLSIAYIAGPQSQWTRFEKECFAGSLQQAQHLGYQLQHFSTADYDSPAHLGEILGNRSYTGVLFRRINTKSHIEGFPLERFSLVACGRGSIDPGCNIVMPHHQHNLHIAWQHLRDQGHTRIACILLENDPLAELPEFYLGALLQAQGELPTSEQIPVFLCRDHDKKRLAEWIQKWQPQAIIGCVEHIHHWVDSHRKLTEHAPEFICLEKSDFKNKHVIGIDLRPQLMGTIAINQLDRAIRENERGIPQIRQTIQIESPWYDAP